MKQLEIDTSELNLGRNNISRYIKKLSNKFHRRATKGKIKRLDFDSIPNHKQRRGSVFNEY